MAFTRLFHAATAVSSRTASIIAPVAAVQPLASAMTARRVASSPRCFASTVAAAADLAGTDSSAEAVGQRRKYYSHHKRASQTLSDVLSEANQRMQLHISQFRPEFPAFKVGDAIELVFAPEVGDKEGTLVRGTVIAKRNKGLDSSFSIINRSGDDAYIATYKYSSPLLRTIRIMRRQHANAGKRVKRAKLYWLWGAKESLYKVSKDTKEQWETDLERRIRRELAARGRVASKKNIMEEKQKLLRTGKGILQVDKFQ